MQRRSTLILSVILSVIMIVLNIFNYYRSTNPVANRVGPVGDAQEGDVLYLIFTVLHMLVLILIIANYFANKKLPDDQAPSATTHQQDPSAHKEHN